MRCTLMRRRVWQGVAVAPRTAGWPTTTLSYTPPPQAAHLHPGKIQKKKMRRRRRSRGIFPNLDADKSPKRLVPRRFRFPLRLTNWQESSALDLVIKLLPPPLLPPYFFFEILQFPPPNSSPVIPPAVWPVAGPMTAADKEDPRRAVFN